ncbi:MULTISPECIES: hypothetical protein, partial [unclassified Microbispora]|uniref:hypothetical protein n=1 Tax=unclassified Microbispora TaxID=2614687 RepID=UPI00197BBB64
MPALVFRPWFGWGALAALVLVLVLRLRRGCCDLVAPVFVLRLGSGAQPPLVLCRWFGGGAPVALVRRRGSGARPLLRPRLWCGALGVP